MMKSIALNDFIFPAATGWLFDCWSWGCEMGCRGFIGQEVTQAAVERHNVTIFVSHFELF